MEHLRKSKLEKRNPSEHFLPSGRTLQKRDLHRATEGTEKSEELRETNYFPSLWALCLSGENRLRVSRLQLFAIRRPGVVAEPAKARQALAKSFADRWGQPGVDVFEAAPPGIAFCSGVQGEEPLPALARRAGARVE
jgi:hypothetical protein